MNCAQLLSFQAVTDRKCKIARNGAQSKLSKKFKICYSLTKQQTSRGRLAQWQSVRFVNSFTRGPRFESRRGFFFSVANLFVKRIDSNLQQSDELHQLTQPCSRKAVENGSTKSEEERSLGNWSYDVIRDRVTSYTLLRNSTTILATQDDNQLSYG